MQEATGKQGKWDATSQSSSPMSWSLPRSSGQKSLLRRLRSALVCLLRSIKDFYLGTLATGQESHSPKSIPSCATSGRTTLTSPYRAVNLLTIQSRQKRKEYYKLSTPASVPQSSRTPAISGNCRTLSSGSRQETQQREGRSQGSTKSSRKAGN